MSTNIDEGKQTFLQPPHFRSIMSADLIDQIISRFGRAALDLVGDYYNRPDSDINKDHDNNSASWSPSSRVVMDSRSFEARLKEYMTKVMGGNDLYCCPLCYTEAHRRLVSTDEDNQDDDSYDDNQEDDEEGDMPRSKYAYTQDPMAILGYLDNDDFKLASTFCFTKISDLKEHLREEHKVDPSILDGNDLYKRFKIRDSDGLLQRYIENLYKRSTTYQGAMSSYWHEGNNQMFIQLWHLSKRYKELKEIINEMSEEIDEEDQIEEADKMLFDRAQSYLDSFRNRAKRVWVRLSAPYRKATEEELNDFLADDDDDDDGDAEEDRGLPPQINFNPISSATPEDEIIEHLRRKRIAGSGHSSESDEIFDEEEDEGLLVEDESNNEDALSDNNDGKKNEYNANISSGEEEYYSESDEQNNAERHQIQQKVSSSKKRRILESDDEDD